ncbi:MAG TPA: SCP2 sterol-binding domain-containing protein [Candidatus Binatia bacterium]|nr:SCP2 sterol-binding domain-containing protein [Candidatus Binatia bacterium]
MADAPPPTASLGRADRAARFFFMHLGSLVAVFVYFTLAGRAAYAPEGVRRALTTALAVMSVYVLLAAWRSEVKYADFGLWVMFAVGTVGAWAGAAPVVALFRTDSGAILFTTFALVALVPLVLGHEPFTYYYARRSTPPWQQKLPVFDELNRVIAWLWAGIFVTAATLCAHAPRDPRYTLLYPNLLVFAVGMPAPLWLVPLYLRLFPPPRPRNAEALIMGMPLAFDRRAAGDAKATFQFHVSGSEPGAYQVRVARGKAVSVAGTDGPADVTIHTPDTVWVRIAHGELDGARALLDGLYRVEGNLEHFARLSAWFPG